MSNIGIIREEKATSIGNFLVGRLLPFREKRSIGPFVFIDHMGPAKLKEFENLDVGPHPHIGLSTLTFLFEGAINHTDTLGNNIEITPGAVNWMTAGKGVVHAERTPSYLRTTEKSLHGLQIWIALPKEFELTDPNFTHIEAGDIPAWEENGIFYRLIAGEVMNKKSPVPVYSDLYMLEIKAPQTTSMNIGEQLFGESGLYILEGSITTEDKEFGPKQILIAKDSKLCNFTIHAGTTIYLFGGTPFPEERHIFWNFVATDKELIEKAKDDWTNQRMGKIAGETEWVPLPEFKANLKA